MDRYVGNPVSQGVAVAKVLLYQPHRPQIGSRLYGATPAERLAVYYQTRDKALQELSVLAEKLHNDKGEQGNILLAQQELLLDVVLQEEMEAALQEMQPDAAIDTVYRKYAEMLAAVPDAVIMERASDLLDINARLLRILEGGAAHSLDALDADCIIVAQDLLPSDTAALDRRYVRGIIAETGGENSHSAILARSYGIPAILGVSGIMEALTQGEIVILDAQRGGMGEIFLRADQALLETYREKAQAYAEEKRRTAEYLGREAYMRDGTRIDIQLNIASGSQEELAFAPYTEGVGLFRTEFLYMNASAAPSEEVQFAVYKRVLEAFGQKPVILRTMDIGGDKEVPYLNMPAEQNPFLGNRALRLCLSRRDLFKAQLRAALRASIYGNLWIMFPMVTDLEDIRRAKEAVQEAREELLGEGAQVAQVKLGIMIEVPSIAIIADLAAQEVDFASIGTNDLCQYLMAADRMNPAVAHYYQSYHPALLRVMKQIITAFTAQGKPVGICGEMGGNVQATALLIGLGLRKLSMGAESIPAVKKRLSTLTLEDARRLADQALGMKAAQEVLSYIKEG